MIARWANAICLAAIACAPVEEPGSRSQTVFTENALMANALMANALMANALMANALMANALMANALMANALMANALSSDPDSRQFLSYVYSCAMPAGVTERLELPGGELVLRGGVGLAPEWGQEGGSCGERCQRWISACLLARTNFWGVPIEISMRGPHPALVSTPEELATFALREGSYFGNLFTNGALRPAPEDDWCQGPDDLRCPTDLHACSGPASSVPQLTRRFCSSTASDCAMNVDRTCTGPGPAACERIDPTDGAVYGCYAKESLFAGERVGERWDEVITVFVKEPFAVCGDGVCTGAETWQTCGDCSSGWAAALESGDATVAVDGKGRAVVAAVATDELELGGLIAKLPGQSGLVMAALDSSGRAEWTRVLATWPIRQREWWEERPLAIGQIQSTAQGDIYVAGAASAEVSWIDEPFPGKGGFLLKLSPTGSLRWRVAEPPGGLALLPDGGPILAREFGSLSAFDAAGEPSWSKAAYLGASAVATSAAGDIFYFDSWGRLVRFAPQQDLYAVLPVPSDDPGLRRLAVAGDAIVKPAGTNEIAKYSFTGELLWTASAPIERFAANAEGEVVVGGDRWWTGSSWIAKLDRDGNLLWSRELGGGPTYEHRTRLASVALAEDGTAYASGSFFVTSVFDGWLLGREPREGDTGATFLVKIPGGAQ
jgi:outer membrane protein assembly factor BamB